MCYEIWKNGQIIEWMRIYCDALVIISKQIVMLFNSAEYLEH